MYIVIAPNKLLHVYTLATYYWLPNITYKPHIDKHDFDIDNYPI